MDLSMDIHIHGNPGLNCLYYDKTIACCVLSLTASEIFNVECNAMADMTLIPQRSMSFILVPIDFSYTTSWVVNSNFCSRTHRLAKIHSVNTDDEHRRTQHYSISATVWKHYVICHATQYVTGTMARSPESDSVVVLNETPRRRGSLRTNLQLLVPVLRLNHWNVGGICILQTQYDNYDYDAPESRWRRQGTLATGQLKEGILIDALYLWCIRCNADSHELFEKIFCIAVTSASVERGFSTCGLSMHTVHAWVTSY